MSNLSLGTPLFGEARAKAVQSPFLDLMAFFLPPRQPMCQTPPFSSPVPASFRHRLPAPPIAPWSFLRSPPRFSPCPLLRYPSPQLLFTMEKGLFQSPKWFDDPDALLFFRSCPPSSAHPFLKLTLRRQPFGIFLFFRTAPYRIGFGLSFFPFSVSSLQIHKNVISSGVFFFSCLGCVVLGPPIFPSFLFPCSHLFFWW